MSKIVKLSELFMTKYFYNTFITDVRYLFDHLLIMLDDPSHNFNHETKAIEDLYNYIQPLLQQQTDAEVRKNKFFLGDYVVFDLAECVFSVNFADFLDNYIKTFPFTDTADATREKLIKVNFERIALQDEEEVPFPDYDHSISIYDNMNVYSRHVTYNASNISVALQTADADISLAYLIMLTLARPSLKIDYGAYLYKIGEYLKDRMNMATYPAEEFYFLSTQFGVYEVSRSDFAIHGLTSKVTNFSDLEGHGVLIPKDFGTQRLIATADCPNSKYWIPIREDCTNKLKGLVANRPKDILTVLSKLEVKDG